MAKAYADLAHSWLMACTQTLPGFGESKKLYIRFAFLFSVIFFLLWIVGTTKVLGIKFQFQFQLPK